MPSFRRRITARVLVVGAGVAALLGFNAPPAGAGTVTVNYTCAAITGPWGHKVFDVTVMAPATVSRGQTGTVQVAMTDTVNSSTSLAAGVVRGTMTLHLGGVGSGTVDATGMTNPAISPGTPWRVSGGTAQVTFANAGTVTFTPGVFRAGAWGCGVRTGYTAPVAATTDVTP
ncbi:hypothetical protein ABGB17_28875 [Sphaerisporangium sp. B11E5]|uniref:hypothetical protein n=1 Tax=Sphaerisporangium sp. B11E5 TaxID=3153563 RepID=UPI00325CC7E9